LVYVAQSANGKDELVAARIDPDADEPSEPRVLARGRDPVFTPDGEWVVYSAATSAGQRLWRVRPDGGGRAPLGRGLHEEVHPAVSPDGRFVAYVSQEADRDSLRVRRFDGSGDRLLLESGDGSTPAW
jgi:TolB protein